MRHITLVLGITALAGAPVFAMQQPPRAPQHVVPHEPRALPALHAALAQLPELHQLTQLHELTALSELHQLSQLAELHELRALSGLHQLSRLAELPAPIHAAGHFFDDRELPPESWLPQDPADSLWNAARAALNAGDASRAATLYRRLRTEQRFARSELRSHAFYWEAYSRQRIGTTSEMRSALNILRDLRRAYPSFENMGEVDRLESRLNADLAAAGDAAAGTRVATDVNRAVSTQCPDQEMRVAVVDAMITMSAAQAMPTLRTLMSRKDACNAPLRQKAVFIIAQNRSTEAADLLLEAAKNDPDPKVRHDAVFWLSQVDSERAVDAIAEILRTSTADSKLMDQAVFALSQHRSPRANQMLRDIASRPGAPTHARGQAIFWLGQRNDPNTVSLIRQIYASLDDAELKNAAVFALSQVRGGGDILLDIALDTSQPLEARKQALFFAGQQNAVTVSKLQELYNQMPNRDMRNQILFTLSQRNEPAALDLLMEIARRDRDTELRKQAIFWIGQSKDPRAAKFLADLLGG